MKAIDFKRLITQKLTSFLIEENEASIEANILIEHIIGIKKKDFLINPDIEIPKSKQDGILKLIEKRVNQKMPVQYLINKAPFMGMDFYVDENVLIPRPETEILVEQTLKIINEINDKSLKIIDIGTGSGCIPCSIAKFAPHNPAVFAVDISQKALEIAIKNAESLGVSEKIKFIKSDIFSSVEGHFDIIVSNPPYIPLKELSALQAEVVQHEPHLALFAEDEKGISFYEKLIQQASQRIKPNGFLILEIGINQAQSITEILKENNFSIIEITKDFAEIERIITAQYNND